MEQFYPCQIVCLEHQNYLLYSEVIQVILQRESCWVRPLLLVFHLDQDDSQDVFDVRCVSDLIFPFNFFRPALDTEVIPLLSQLSKLDLSPQEEQLSRSKFQELLKEIWR
ncbi:hypothetical protein C7H19_12765 [Aphanothece hegewaldii CCALA 016]|uniref:Uncharacterized protein n=1 Tax=Aphanothece hegewaldii CCALA 016 TaxID=2107694 RepID=A0A2T1LXB1_9CHRO|nr:hypothetical protein [Aphanothece hegewaldii]PSF36832.1 hypothetical protein C7H19_12765 [Aphanothece hegewaldii CCALA 016]